MRLDTFLEELAAMTRLSSVPRVLWLCCLAAALPAQGCVNDLLQVTDPDIITDDQLTANTAAGALALHNGVILRLAQATAGTQGPDALFEFGGLLTDEWRAGDTLHQRHTPGPRHRDPPNTLPPAPLPALQPAPGPAGAGVRRLRPD